jgi:hypothetical protein
LRFARRFFFAHLIFSLQRFSLIDGLQDLTTGGVRARVASLGCDEESEVW